MKEPMMKMTASTKTTTCKPTVPPSRPRECLPCDIQPFCRNNYFTGKLLTERDFTAEQRYLMDKLRLHHLGLHGWGAVCGLKVKPHPYCPELRLVVEPGLAIDACGREILVTREIEIELPKAPEPPPAVHEPCPPEPPECATKDEPAAPEPGDQPCQCGPAPPECPMPPPLCPPAINLYLCLRYQECETEFMPAPFDECVCNGNNQKPNRICEGYSLELYDDKPPGWERIRKAKASWGEGDCADLYETMLEACPPPGCLECVPLAVIYDYRPGEAVTADMIDNWEYRPLLPSTSLLDRVVRCILEKVPARELTCISDINWIHGGEYPHHAFMSHFVGDSHSPRAFEVAFSGPVREDGLSSLSFQAVVVKHTEKGRRGGILEVVPAMVWARSDEFGTKFYLHIERGYAEHCLCGISFDLYITLRCDVIVDARGCPVDGDLLAHTQSDGTYVVAPPTGDGIPGGTFESWIHVLA
jgi:hypothetical protein